MPSKCVMLHNARAALMSSCRDKDACDSHTSCGGPSLSTTAAICSMSRPVAPQRKHHHHHHAHTSKLLSTRRHEEDTHHDDQDRHFGAVSAYDAPLHATHRAPTSKKTLAYWVDRLKRLGSQRRARREEAELQRKMLSSTWLVQPHM